LKIDIVDFAVRFVARMRYSRDVTNKPSTRQALSIPQLLIARVLRTGGEIKTEDLLKMAVATSAPENQNIAREIAEQVIFGMQPAEESAQEQESEIEAELAEELDEIRAAISEILAEMELAEHLDSSNATESMRFMQKLQRGEGGEEAQSAVEILGGLSQIPIREITGLDVLLDEARLEARKRIGALTPAELKASVTLRLADEIIENSQRSWECSAAKALQLKEESAEYEPDEARRLRLTAADPWNKVFEEEEWDSASDMAQFLRFMEEIDPSLSDTVSDLAQSVKERINTLEELQTVAQTLGAHISTNGFTKRVLDDAVQRYNLAEAYNIAKNIDRYTTLNIREPLLEQWLAFCREMDTLPTLDQIAQSAYRSPEWYEMLLEVVKALEKDTFQSQNPSADFFSYALQCMQMSGRSLDRYSAQHLRDFADRFANNSVVTSSTPEQLKNIVRNLRKTGFALNEDTLEKRGREVGMTEEEIMELLSPSFVLLRKAIAAGVEDFQRLSDMINMIAPTEAEIIILVEDSLESENRGALGALGHFDLGTTLEAAEQLGGEQALEMAVSALTAGPGENLLVQWFTHRERIPEPVFNMVKALAKKLMLELGIHYARARLGSSEMGPIPVTTVRPYVLGDDMDLVDMEETVEALINKGKALHLVDYDDFMVLETYHGRRAVVIELDVSGSMTGEKLAYMSICATMLVYGMRREELALCFFESSTHKVKNIEEEVDMDELAEQLLTLTAMGGTMIGAALDWAKINLDKSDVREKLNVVFTDSEIFDFEEAIPKFQEIHGMGVKSVLVVPEQQFSQSSAQRLAQESKGYLVKVDKWSKFPDIISKVVGQL